MAHSQKKAKMFELIEKWEDCGQSREHFCQEHNLNLSQFAYWRTKYLKAHPSKEIDEAFIPVKPATDSGLEIKYPNGVSIKVPENTSTAQLQSLIHLL